jgi:hypothetical protein
LCHFKIIGRANSQHQLNKFTRVRDLSDPSGTIHKRERTAMKPKSTEEVIEEVLRRATLCLQADGDHFQHIL